MTAPGVGTPTWTADDFYAKAAKPNAPKAPTLAPPKAEQHKNAQETNADDFYAKARKFIPGETGKAVATPASPSDPTKAPTATAAAVAQLPPTEITTTAKNLRTLGVALPEGVELDDAKFVAFHDSAIKAHRAAQDAEVEGWAAESRRTIPAAEVEAASAFVRELGDQELLDDLALTGLGSKASVIRLAAKLHARLSERRTQ